jgi:flavin reductase (DIM6/NTAB) family NADH-FMN oxidoreductase RutF
MSDPEPRATRAGAPETDATDPGEVERSSPEDRLRRRVLWKMPSGLYLLGSRAGSRTNLMTLSWAMQVATAPKLVAVSVETAALTHELIAEGGVFAISILRRDDRAVVRKFVKPVGPSDMDLDESGTGAMRGVEVRSYLTGAPVAAGAAGFVDCTLVSSIPLGSHSLFVGEVVDFGFPEGDEDSPVLRTEDTRMNYGG